MSKDRLARKLLKAAGQTVPSLQVLNLENNTMGYHGYGEYPERAAPNPWVGPFDVFEIHTLNEYPQLEQLLLGQPAFIFVNDAGSYHERWLYVEVYVQVSEEMAQSEQWEHLPVGALREVGRRFKQAWTGPFQGMADIIQRLREMGNQASTPTGTSEQYWEDQIQRRVQPDRRRLNPLTGEYEIQHEGD